MSEAILLLPSKFSWRGAQIVKQTLLFPFRLCCEGLNGIHMQLTVDKEICHRVLYDVKGFLAISECIRSSSRIMFRKII